MQGMVDIMNQHELAFGAPNATFLGFDFGEKNTGVAVGQRITGTATALETIRFTSKGAFWSSISRLVKTWEPTAFVVGMPYHPNPEEGEENHIVELIHEFRNELGVRFSRPVFLMDETLSTKESQSIFYSQRSKKSVQFIDIKDELAATLILQTWLKQTSPTELVND